jgi:hypothetical protein
VRRGEDPRRAIGGGARRDPVGPPPGVLVEGALGVGVPLGLPPPDGPLEDAEETTRVPLLTTTSLGRLAGVPTRP